MSDGTPAELGKEILARMEQMVSTKVRLMEAGSEIFEQMTLALVDALKNGKRVYLFGNGGSAAEAEHFAGELQGRFLIDRDPLPVTPFTVNSALLTAVSNDYSYDRIFERQVQAQVQQGDVVIGISTSGNSPNVVHGLAAAKTLGAVTIGWTGQGGGAMNAHCDLVLHAPSDSTPRIQECHHAATHLVCEMVEQLLFGSDA